MFDVVLLGSGAAFPPIERENCSVALQWDAGVWLIDCGASPHRRMQLAGLDPDDLRGIFITHSHPDHLYGLPSLVHCLIPSGRSEPLPVLAHPRALECARTVLGAFRMHERPEVPLSLIEIDPAEGSESADPVYEIDGLALRAEPVEHTPESLGVRAEAGGRIVAYSGDTAPCDGVRNLARGAHMLVHEATFSERDRDEIAPGHSTARDAAEAAAEAGVEKLLMVHFLERTLIDPDALIMEAQKVFGGHVEIGDDFGRYPV